LHFNAKQEAYAEQMGTEQMGTNGEQIGTDNKQMGTDNIKQMGTDNMSK
jgi:hypothetical protein